MIELFIYALILFVVIVLLAPQLFPDVIKEQIEQRLDKIRNDQTMSQMQHDYGPTVQNPKDLGYQ